MRISRRLIAAALAVGAFTFTPNFYNLTPIVHAQEDKTALAEEKFQEGDKFFEQGDYQTAIEKYTAAIGLNPNHALAYDKRSQCYEKLGDTEKAEADSNKAVEILIQKSNEINEQKRAEIARIEAEAKRIEAVTKIIIDGNKLVENGDFKGALKKYTAAIEMEPKDAMLFAIRGGTYYRLKKYKKAIVDLNKAIELDSNLYIAYQFRGDCYVMLGKFNEAFKDWDKSEELRNKE